MGDLTVSDIDRLISSLPPPGETLYLAENRSRERKFVPAGLLGSEWARVTPRCALVRYYSFLDHKKKGL